MPGRLPPGQIETKRFPVVGERAPSSGLSPDTWSLVVTGEVETEITLDYEELVRRGDRSLTFDIHCVTSWTRFDSTFTGLPLAELLTEARVLPGARHVSFQGFSDRGHHTSLPLDVATADTWVVHAFAGAPLEVEHGGPVRTVTPGRYFYKSLKWLKRVELIAEDRPGWWEVNSSYHNNAEPWSGAERFSTGSVRPGQLQRFLEAKSYDKYRQRVMIGLDLRSWSPAHSDLRRLHLKNCDLRGVDLAGADLSYSNLSLSDLRGAVLVGTTLRGSDLEGANFSGADLRGADLSDTALSATRFVDGSGYARLEGARFEGSFGLMESQEAYVAGQVG